MSAHSPRDDFPPHGYLDNPQHSWRRNPGGALRSRPPSGMGWHVPNYGSYGRNQFMYRVHLHVGIEIGGVRLLTPPELARHGVRVGCDLHTANRLRYIWEHPSGVRMAATFFLAYEHALGCLIELAHHDTGGAPSAVSPQALEVRLWLAEELAHNPATSRLWEHGLYAVPPGAQEPETHAAGLLGACPEGDAFAFGAARADGVPLAPSGIAHDPADWSARAPLPAGREPPGLQVATLCLAYDVTLPPGGTTMLCAALARGVSTDAALAQWSEALRGCAAVLAERVEEDERFWVHAPRLDGDWPGHWRRGLATDLETLRMVARPPAGVFRGRWDGMQVQAPRSVLAETALDALALGWADAPLAQAILLECFRAAPRANVPCMREDGSYNMVADDGAICGTGPEWGWPLAAVDALWRRTGDRTWLGTVYPYAAHYLSWWLASRTDEAGWLVHACSWESGQDVSARFGAQQTGGSDVRHLRPVDLQAAASQGCALLAGWADLLGVPGDAERWRAEASRLSAQVREMWRKDWYHDYDARARRWSSMRDPMQLAPLCCGVADAQQAAALRTAFAALPKHGGVWPAMVWPPVAHTVLEAALAAGLDAPAAEMAAAVVERAWRRMDCRTMEPDGGLPGVARELWPEAGVRESAGIEGYGWGALTSHFLIRYLVGVRELEPNSVLLVPALPRTWRRPGATFSVGPLGWGHGPVTLCYRVPVDAASDAPTALDVLLTIDGASGTFVVEDAQEGRTVCEAAADAASQVRLEWRSVWLRPSVVRRV